MSRYFRYFPTVQYDLIQNGNPITLTNIMRRFVVDSKLKDQVDIFYDYTIQAGDRLHGAALRRQPPVARAAAAAAGPLGLAQHAGAGQPALQGSKKP